MKKKSQSWYRKKCVARAKKVALERDNYTCVRCGKRKDAGYAIHASHVYPEGTYRSMSADPLNLKALCYQCHFLFWHKNIIEAKDWFANKYPDRLEYLKKLSTTPLKVDWRKEYQKQAI
jgi:hypothetical protein